MSIQLRWLITHRNINVHLYIEHLLVIDAAVVRGTSFHTVDEFHVR
jgi:hypothetical protein